MKFLLVFFGLVFTIIYNIGYTEPINEEVENKTIYAGAILNIKQINHEGFFIGDFDFAESEGGKNLIDSLGAFYGKIDYHISFKKKIHPLNHKTNNVYKGKLYFVERLDIPFKISRIESFVTHEYNVLHYREMGLLIIKLSKQNKPDNIQYPKEFNLLKSKGLAFEPYKTLKEVVFNRYTYSDKKSG